MRKFTATLFLLATLSLGTLAVTSVPAMAEENLGKVNYVTDLGFYTYTVTQYPSRANNFFFFPNSYVEFKAQNGKYWMLESSKFNMSMVTNRSNVGQILGKAGTARLENFDVYFYAPDGSKIGGFKDARINSPFSIPRNGEDFEYVTVRIENHSAQNIDARFVVWSPIEPVMATPIGK